MLTNFDFVIKYIKRIDNSRINALSKKLGYKENKRYKKVIILKVLENKNLALIIKEIIAIKPKR